MDKQRAKDDHQSHHRKNLLEQQREFLTNAVSKMSKEALEAYYPDKLLHYASIELINPKDTIFLVLVVLTVRLQRLAPLN